MVEVQKLEVFCDFCPARATLCGNRRGRGAKTRGFLRFLPCLRNSLRGSAWSRCKNSRFFAISALLAQPSAGIGVVEVHKREVFCDFCPARATLCGHRRGRGAKTRGFLRFLRCSRNPLRESAWSRCKNSRFLRLLLFELVLGRCLVVRAPAPATGGSRVRFLPGPRVGVARCNLHFNATCAEQLAQSKLHRATCADQLAPTSLRRAPCLEQLAQSNLRRATCTEQLAQSSLHCLVLSRACFTNASCREKERILQHWADLACDVLLSGQPWSSFCRSQQSCSSSQQQQQQQQQQQPAAAAAAAAASSRSSQQQQQPAAASSQQQQQQQPAAAASSSSQQQQQPAAAASNNLQRCTHLRPHTLKGHVFGGPHSYEDRCLDLQ